MSDYTYHKQLEETEHMKNIAMNTLEYTGIVTLSQYIGSKKVKIAEVHNTGGASLFSFLANCLAGDFSLARAFAPTKVKFLTQRANKAGDGYEYYSLTSFVTYRTPPVPRSSAEGSSVRFSFTIPRDFISSLVIGASNETIGIGLYASSTRDVESESGDFMAFCELDNIDKNSLINTYLVIDWELIISNAASASATTDSDK